MTINPHHNQSLDKLSLKASSFIKPSNYVIEMKNNINSDFISKRSINKSASLKIPISNSSLIKSPFVLSPKTVQPTPKSINKKLKQLYDLISPRRISSRNATSMSPPYKNDTVQAVDRSVAISKSRNKVDIIKQEKNESLTTYPNSIVAATSTETNNLSLVRKLFKKFKCSFETIRKDTTVALGSRPKNLKKSAQKRKFDQVMII